jgi:hypothetical protein
MTYDPHQVKPPSWAFIGAIAVFGPVAILALAAILIVGMVYIPTKLFPAHSAEFHIKELDATVGIQFYRLWRVGDGDGRYLTVSTRHGHVTHEMCGFDWAHWSRTSVYLAGADQIAVVGAQECDYLISVEGLVVSRAFKVPSADWVYLGAFDFTASSGDPSARELRFVPASEQRECIEEATEPPMYDWAVRNSARRSSC